MPPYNPHHAYVWCGFPLTFSYRGVAYVVSPIDNGGDAMRLVLMIACVSYTLCSLQSAYAQQTQSSYDSGVRLPREPDSDDTIIVTARRVVRELPTDYVPSESLYPVGEWREGDEITYTRQLYKNGPLELNLITRSRVGEIGLSPIPEQESTKVPRPQLVIRW